MMRQFVSEVIQCVHEIMLPTTPSTIQFVECDARCHRQIRNLQPPKIAEIVDASRQDECMHACWAREYSLHILIVDQSAFEDKQAESGNREELSGKRRPSLQLGVIPSGLT